MKARTLQQQIADQCRWMSSCGGGLAGYTQNYAQYGRDADQAAAIYYADLDALRKLIERNGRMTRDRRYAACLRG